MKLGDWVKINNKHYHHYKVPAQIVKIKPFPEPFQDQLSYTLRFINDQRVGNHYVLRDFIKITKKEVRWYEKRNRIKRPKARDS